MSKLEDLKPNASVRGILPDSLVTVVSVQWYGSEALELTYKTPTGTVANQLLYRDDEPRLEAVEHRRRRRTLPPGVRGAADSSGAPVRPGPGRPHLGRRAAPAPDHGGLRG